MVHAAPMSETKRRVIMGFVLTLAGLLILAGTIWAGNDLNKWAEAPDGSTPPASTAAAPATFTPAPTSVSPTCAPDEVWSNHASKCYVPEGSSRIDAIPSPGDCPAGQVWSKHASKCYIPKGPMK